MRTGYTRIDDADDLPKALAIGPNRCLVGRRRGTVALPMAGAFFERLVNLFLDEAVQTVHHLDIEIFLPR